MDKLLKNVCSVTLCICALFVTGCELMNSGNNSSDKPLKEFPDLFGTEQSMRHLALMMPSILSDQELNSILIEEIDKNITDEAYTLWNDIANKQSPSGKTINNSIALLNHNTNPPSLLRASDFLEIEGLKVYIYSYETWDKQSVLPFTFEPISQNDIDVTELEIFFSDGSSTIISGTTPPDFPFAIIGIYEGSTDGIPTPNKTMNIGRDEILDKIKLEKDHEPFWKGKAEIYVVSAGTLEEYKMKTVDNLTWVNYDGNWYNRDRILMFWDTDYWGDFVGFGVIEQDGGNKDYKVNIKYENLKVKVSAESNDDFVGRQTSVSNDHSNPFYDDFYDVQWRLKF